jgi:Uncharacterized membrane-anchored protein conserved in bacteria
MSVKVEGFDITKIMQPIRSNLRTELEAIAEDLINYSQSEVPVDTGDLRNDCQVLSQIPSSQTENIVVGYKDMPYAHKQHEDFTLNHPNGGKAKFLEDPYDEHKSDFEARLKKAALEALK